MAKVKTDLREVVLDILLSLEKTGAHQHSIIRDRIDEYDELDPQQKAFMNRLALGTLERMIQIDYVINKFSKIETERMEPAIRAILRMSVYQILFMDGVPDAAAVNEAVNLAAAKRYDGLKGFVNGVLREIARNKEEIPWPRRGSDVSGDAFYLSVTKSEPYWLCKQWIMRYGFDKTEAMLESFLTVRPNVIRINLTSPREELAETFTKFKEMAAAGQIGLRQSPLLPYAIELRDSGSIRRLPGFKEGHWMVQDTSSMFVAHVAGLRPGQTVIDVCAAPGGKAIHASEIMKHTGKVLACDLSVNKCMRIKENVTRLHAGNVVSVKEADATVHDRSLEGTADAVFVDAPCSGLGVIGRKPDIKLNVTPASIAELVEVQRKIFTSVWNYAKVGGTIIYSTCTISSSENEENVKWFLRNFPVELVSINELLPPVLKDDENAADGMLQLLPGIHGTDGFFIARLRRKA